MILSRWDCDDSDHAHSYEVGVSKRPKMIKMGKTALITIIIDEPYITSRTINISSTSFIFEYEYYTNFKFLQHSKIKSWTWLTPHLRHSLPVV